MSTNYLLYGLFLVVIFLAIIIYFYTPKRKDEVEGPKYSMLEDDESDEPVSKPESKE